ncbi:MAG: leucine-rich repeat domain-containing protein, partial [Christensenellales bacterium]
MKLNLRQTKNKLNFMLWGYKIEDGKLIFNDKIENITLKSSTKVHCVQLKNSMKEQVKEIVLPKNLKEIEPELFKDFTFLEKITFNENLEVIGKSAFEGCVSLKEIKLPNKVKEIGESAFSNCKSLKNVELPSSIESIGADCFSCCTKLKTAILDKCNIETIPYRCFYRSGLKTIKLPSNLKEIDREAFTKTKIDKIKFPNSLVSIGAKAFANCESLLEIDLQNTQIEVLNYDTFYADLKLDKVILPETLKKIGTGVFYKTSIQTIELPQSVECIGESCFAQCDKLEQITLPQNIKTIKSCVFSRCINLKNIDLSNTNLQMIALGAFLNCKSLMQIKLPKTIERLDEQVFYKSGITSIDLSETKVEFIGHCCFEDCVNLEKIVLSDSLKCIGHKAFKSCPITSITLPSTLKDIQYDAFTSCNKLESIDLSNCEISTITNNMFNNCTSLKEVRLPQKLTTIGKNAFENTAISEMEFPASLRYICEQAFIDCKNLTQIDLSNTDLTTIESKAFKGCTSLKYAKLSPFLKELNNDTFEQQTILELYTLPYKEEIMEDTFSSFEYYHSHIRHYNIPSLKSMPNTIILHLGQLKTEKEKKNNSFNFNEFIKSTLSSNTQPHTYIQINDTDIIVTNDKTNLIPKISYYFYPILRKNTYWENNLNNYKFYDDLIKYEIPLPKDTLRYFNEIYSGDTTPNFSKFKRVSNIIEHIYATTNIAIENLNDFYRLAINLGAFSQDEQTRTTVCNFLKDKLIRGELNLFTMHQDYD